jgi:hypothetical protein
LAAPNPGGYSDAVTVVEDPPSSLYGRDLLSAADLTRAEVEQVFSTAWALKDEFRATRRHAARRSRAGRSRCSSSDRACARG